MSQLIYLALFFFVVTANQTFAQTRESLQQKIQHIIATKKAKVGVSLSGNQGKDTLSINGDEHFPLQSVFKFHIALAVLAEIDKGNLAFDQKVKITKKDLLPNLHSPLREKYPNGASLSISEILEHTASQSDNVGCDILIKLMGGPQVIEDYFIKNNFTDISIKINEETMQKNWDLQFQNWTTPKAANKVLISFYEGNQKFLSKESYDFIWKVMRETQIGKNRLKGQLPTQTVVAHKTGSSGTNPAGLTAAVNDIGIVFLPNGHYYFISVFVTNSTEDSVTNEKIIADISKATWDFFTSKSE